MTDTVAYIRVSTDEQARGDRTSMSQQREACEALARRMNRAIGQWFEDPGASGGSANRPGFQALVAFCRANPRPKISPGAVLVLNLSRWGRFPLRNEPHWWMFELERVGWELRCAEGDEATDPTARHVMRSLTLGLSADYREAIRANARRGWQGTARQGYWQTEAPFGYRREALSHHGSRRTLELGQRKGQDEKVRLLPGPEEEVRLVRWLFRQYASGEIGCERLAELAYARHPGKRWSKQVVRAMLQNPAYVGDVIWGRRQAVDSGQPIRTPDPSGWVVARDAHPGLVSRGLFEQVQRRLEANRKRTRLTAGGYPLSGLLTCAHCGDTLIGGGGPKGPPGDPNRYRCYRHAVLSNPRPFAPATDCPARMSTVPKRVVEPAVIAVVTDLVGSQRFRKLVERGCDRLLARQVGKPETLQREAERRQAKLLAERDRMVKLAARGTLTEEEIGPRMEVLRLELAQAEQEAQQARFAGRRVMNLGRVRDELLARAANLGTALASASGPKLRELIRPWVHSAVVDRIENVVKLAVLTLPIEAGFLLSTTGEGADSRMEKEIGPLLRRAIPLPPARSMRRKRLA